MLPVLGLMRECADGATQALSAGKLANSAPCMFIIVTGLPSPGALRQHNAWLARFQFCSTPALFGHDCSLLFPLLVTRWVSALAWVTMSQIDSLKRKLDGNLGGILRCVSSKYLRRTVELLQSPVPAQYFSKFPMKQAHIKWLVELAMRKGSSYVVQHLRPKCSTIAVIYHGTNVRFAVNWDSLTVHCVSAQQDTPPGTPRRGSCDGLLDSSHTASSPALPSSMPPMPTVPPPPPMHDARHFPPLGSHATPRATALVAGAAAAASGAGRAPPSPVSATAPATPTAARPSPAHSPSPRMVLLPNTNTVVDLGMRITRPAGPVSANLRRAAKALCPGVKRPRASTPTGPDYSADGAVATLQAHQHQPPADPGMPRLVPMPTVQFSAGQLHLPPAAGQRFIADLNAAGLALCSAIAFTKLGKQCVASFTPELGALQVGQSVVVATWRSNMFDRVEIWPNWMGRTFTVNRSPVLVEDLETHNSPEGRLSAVLADWSQHFVNKVPSVSVANLQRAPRFLLLARVRPANLSERLQQLPRGAWLDMPPAVNRIRKLLQGQPNPLRGKSKRKRGVDPESDDEDLCMDQVPISLVDPYSQGLVHIPVRGEQCRHVACFDFQTWHISAASHQPGRAEATCPHCGQAVRRDNVRIDPALARIMQLIVQGHRAGTLSAVQSSAAMTQRQVLDLAEQLASPPAGSAWFVKPSVLRDLRLVFRTNGTWVLSTLAGEPVGLEAPKLAVHRAEGPDASVDATLLDSDDSVIDLLDSD